MKIKRVEKVQVARLPSEFPGEDLPEVAVGGRSNVGKSSFLNALLRVRGLSTVSRTPGRTRALGFFRVNQEFHLVDLPGYGYAAVPRKVQEKWGQLVEEYLQRRIQLRGMILLLDLRHAPAPPDVQLSAALAEMGLSLLLVGTKADKVPRGRRRHHLDIIRRALPLPQDAAPICFSARTGEGREDVLQALERLVKAPPRTSPLS